MRGGQAEQLNGNVERGKQGTYGGFESSKNMREESLP